MSASFDVSATKVKSFGLFISAAAFCSLPELLPVIQTFAAGPEWKQYSFPIASFKIDGSDMTGVAFLKAMGNGKFEFEIDEVKIK